MEIIIRNEEQKVLNFLNKFGPKRAHHLVHLYQGEQLNQVTTYIETKPFQSLEDVIAMFENFGGFAGMLADAHAQELVNWAYEELTELARLRLSEKLARYRNKAANRAEYGLEPVFRFYKLPDGRWRWQFVHEFRSSGLMHLLVNHIHGWQNEPTAIGILHERPKKNTDENAEQEEQEFADSGDFIREMNLLLKLGVVVSKGRLGWNKRSPAWQYLIKAFPKAIDFSAYNHSLNAPIIPDGFLPRINISFKRLTSPDGVDLATDGSGWYHPESPEMQPLITKYGLCAFQIRMLHPETGLFAKGIVFPSVQAIGADNKPGIVLDWVQIKGKHKALAKQRRTEDAFKCVEGCFLGVLQTWSKPATLSACFEMLENVQMNPRTKEITKGLIGKAMARLRTRGLDGLVADVARKDPVIKAILQLTQVAQTHGLKYHAYQVPRVAQATERKLSNTLWVNAQGAGLRLPSYVCRLDTTVPVGKVVLTDMKAGKKVIAYRFPIVLSEGLLELETIKPPAHLFVDKRTLVSTETYDEVFDTETGTWVRV